MDKSFAVTKYLTKELGSMYKTKLGLLPVPWISWKESCFWEGRRAPRGCDPHLCPSQKQPRIKKRDVSEDARGVCRLQLTIIIHMSQYYHNIQKTKRHLCKVHSFHSVWFQEPGCSRKKMKPFSACRGSLSCNLCKRKQVLLATKQLRHLGMKPHQWWNQDPQGVERMLAAQWSGPYGAGVECTGAK